MWEVDLISQVNKESQNSGMLKGKVDVGSGQDIFFSHQLTHKNITAEGLENVTDLGGVDRIEIGNKRQRQNKEKHHPILEQVFFWSYCRSQQENHVSVSS